MKRWLFILLLGLCPLMWAGSLMTGWFVVGPTDISVQDLTAGMVGKRVSVVGGVFLMTSDATSVSGPTFVLSDYDDAFKSFHPKPPVRVWVTIKQGAPAVPTDEKIRVMGILLVGAGKGVFGLTADHVEMFGPAKVSLAEGIGEALAYAAEGLTFIVLFEGIRRWRERAMMQRWWDSAKQGCRKCGYDLRATPERCPECGTVVEKSGRIRPPRKLLDI